jgi:hypothetical protein
MEVNSMNIFEVAKDIFKPFMDGEKRPLHVGEVMNLWTYLTAVQETLQATRVFHNLIEDKELKEKARDLAENIHQPIIEEITGLLTKENVPLPPPTNINPIADYSHLPVGAKATDEQISNLMVFNNTIAVQFRAEVGAMFAKYQLMTLTFLLTLKPIMEKNGWIRIPPYYHS